MKFVMTKMGIGEHQVTLPEAAQVDLRMVGMIWKEGVCICTHASLEDMEFIKENTLLIGVNLGEDSFTINGNLWKERAGPQGTWAAAWFCWYGNYPDRMFFMPREFPESEFWLRERSSLGVFDISDAKTMYLGKCQHTDTHDKIIAGLK